MHKHSKQCIYMLFLKISYHFYDEKALEFRYEIYHFRAE